MKKVYFYDLEKCYQPTLLEEFLAPADIAKFIKETGALLAANVCIIGFQDDVRPRVLLRGMELTKTSIKGIVKSLLSTVGPNGAYALVFKGETDVLLTEAEKHAVKELCKKAELFDIHELEVIKVVPTKEGLKFSGTECDGVVGWMESSKIKPEVKNVKGEEFALEFCEAKSGNVFGLFTKSVRSRDTLTHTFLNYKSNASVQSSYYN